MNVYPWQDLLSKINPDEVVKVVQDMVRLKSINPPGLEKRMSEYVKNYMISKNIPTETLEFATDRYNVISRLKGKGEENPIIFTGHMDVVPVSKDEEKRWQTDPFGGEIFDGNLHGRDSSDMKAGLGAAMVAMGYLAENGIVPPGDIILVATVDEEALMGGAKSIIKTDVIADAKNVVVCEPTGMELVTCCRGRTWADITVKGLTAHASQKGAGINAIDRTLMLMNKMAGYEIPHQEHPYLGTSFWQITVIKGGVEPAIVPDRCTITVDARLVPGQMPQDIWNLMEQLIAEIKEEVPDFEAEIEILDQREPWVTPADDPMIQKIKGAYEVLSMPYRENGFSGTTDGTIFRRIGMEAVIIGPGDLACVHKENEKVSLEQLAQAVQLYLITMLI
ncbi:M20 family metallopeptidase [Dehalobacterium formicoaceticum]|uniref:M20 family metallopeptidase n=1 Tax=Dehalobacterium formicoaceticum TaxID=51515 RepID=UPI0031F6B63A